MQKSRNAVWPWVLGVVVIGGAGAWLFGDTLRGLADKVDVPLKAPLTTTPASNPTPPAAAPPETPAAPPIQHPVDPRDAADPALPALADSDGPVLEALTTLLNGEGALALLLRDHVVQRVVTHVINLDKTSLPAPAMAVRPVPGSLQVEASEGATHIAAANAERYAPYVTAFTAMDANAAGRAYVRVYPLLQQAYAELGRPDAYFNDRLVAVIDHLLETPTPARPLAVERDDRGRYRFVDASLESRSVGQKLLLRMDADQARAVKQQLRALRAAITRG